MRVLGHTVSIFYCESQKILKDTTVKIFLKGGSG